MKNLINATNHISCMFQKKDKNNQPTNITNPPKMIMDENNQPLKRTVDSVKNDLDEFKKQILNKINLLENSINILDEDYFELKEKTNNKNKTDTTSKNNQASTNNKQTKTNKPTITIDSRIDNIEKTLKELLVFGKLSINNYENIENMKDTLNEIQKLPKEIKLEEDTEDEIERFSKLEKEIDDIKNNQIQFSDD